MDNQEIGAVILKIYEEQKKTNKKIDGVEVEIKTLTSEVKKIDERITSEVEKINERITLEVGKINQRITNEIGKLNKKFDSEIGKVNKRLDKLELEGKDTREIIKSMQQEIRNLKGDIAVIQYEHGKKLDILFDAITGNEERNKENQERFDNIEKILEKHSNQIYYLEKRA